MLKCAPSTTDAATGPSLLLLLHPPARRIGPALLPAFLLAAEQIAHELLGDVPEFVLVLARVVFERGLRQVPELVLLLPREVGDARRGPLGDFLRQVAWRRRGRQTREAASATTRPTGRAQRTAARCAGAGKLTYLIAVLAAKLGHRLLRPLVDFNAQIPKFILRSDKCHGGNERENPIDCNSQTCQLVLEVESTAHTSLRAARQRGARDVCLTSSLPDSSHTSSFTLPSNTTERSPSS